MRTYILAAFKKTREELQVDKSDLTQFYFDETWLLELKKFNFAPGGDVLLFEWLMKGISILACTNWTTEEVCHEEEDNEVYAATTQTRTEEQVRRYNAKEVREPPKEWSKLKSLFNTYSILLRCLFTMYCPHFKATWAVRNVIAGHNGQREHHYSTNRGYLSKLLVWRVLVDSRDFFSKKLMPADFANAIDFDSIAGRPRTKLAQVALDAAGLQINNLERMDFPSKWKNEDNNRKRPGGELGGRTGGGPKDWKGANYDGGHKGGPNFGGGNPSQDRTRGGCKHNLGVPKEVETRLGDTLAQIRRRFTRLSLKTVCQKGSIQLTDLPLLSGYTDDQGRSKVCYLGLLGMCPFDETSCFNILVPEKDLTSDFVRKFTAKIKPCLEGILGSNGQRDHGAGSSGRR